MAREYSAFGETAEQVNIREIEAGIDKLKAENKGLKEALGFYASTDNWSRRDTIFWESIDRRDCADYPHVGGKLASEAM